MATALSSGTWKATTKDVIVLGFIGFISMLGGCSAIVDIELQCAKDADCKHFGYEFVCQSGVCKGAAVACYDPSGLAGHGCYQSSVTGCFDMATGPTVEQTLNACTTAECVEPTSLSVPAPLPVIPTTPPADAQSPKIEVTTTTTPCSIFGKPVLLAVGTPTGATLLSEVSVAVNPEFVVAYIPMSSCDALSVAARDQKLSGFAWYWDPTFTPTLPSARRVCKLEEDTAPSMIVSDVSPASCDVGLAASLGGWRGTLGPVSYVTVAVHDASPVNALTQDAVTGIFGFGAIGVTIPPFTQPSGIVTDASVAWLIPSLAGKSVGYGTWKAESASVAASVAAGDPASTVGLMSADAAARASLRPVALRSTGQGCAVLPDTGRTKNDGANVRDGHYPYWFNSRIFSRATDGAVSANVQALLDVLDGKPLTGDLAANLPSWDVLAHYVERRIIPTCAMTVRKKDDQDFGSLTPYTPALGCRCHFDVLVGVTPSCQTCKGDADCPAHQACAAWGTAKDTRYCEPKAE